MATVTNKSRNTASPTNKAYSTSSKLWSGMEKTWADYPMQWTNPQDFANKSASSASTVTNKSADT